MQKRITTMLAALLLGTTALVGCTQNQTAPNNEPAEETVVETVPEDTAKADETSEKSSIDVSKLVGVWKYDNDEIAMHAEYDFKKDGTGTYKLNVAGQEVLYELKYAIKGKNLSVIFVNNEIFTEEDEFLSPITLEDDNTMIIEDSTGEQLVFEKQ